jgi:hypothetical protein
MLAVFDIEYIFNTYVESVKREAEEKIYMCVMIETCQELGATLEDTIKRVAKKIQSVTVRSGSKG